MMIFLVALSMVLWLWGESYNIVGKYDTEKTYKEKAIDSLNVLVRTPGEPEDWEDIRNFTNETVFSIGLASEPSVMDSDKLDTLKDMPYEDACRLMGFGSERIYIEIRDNDSRRYRFGEDGTPVFSLERLVVYKGKAARLTFDVIAQ
jgi:hypothetical protein